MNLHRPFIGLATFVWLFSASAAELRPAPVWRLNDLSGKPVQLSDFHGKVVILNFWATWCPPCRMEIPGFIQLQNEYSASGLVIVGLSLDQQGPDVVAAFATKHGINYPIVMADQKVIADYGNINLIPTTFVIDRNGNIVATYRGLHWSGTFESAVKPLLAAK